MKAMDVNAVGTTQTEYSNLSNELDNAINQLGRTSSVLDERLVLVKAMPTPNTPKDPIGIAEPPKILSPLGEFFSSQLRAVNKINHQLENILNDLRI